MLVSVIDPGNYRSRISQNARDRSGALDEVKLNSLYAEDYKRILDLPVNRSQYKEPDEVAEAAMHALFNEDPKRRYMVVPNRGEAAWTISTAINELVQLNDQQKYTFSRAEIIAMLDKALGGK